MAMSFEINPELLKYAKWRIETDRVEKQAVVSPGGGGAPPMDPMAMGGGAPPPMDPMAAPPVDPAAAGGGGLDANTIRQIIQEELAAQGATAGGGGAGGAAAGVKPRKIEPVEINTKLWQIMRMLVLILEEAGIPIPADLALGPPPPPEEMATAQQGLEGLTAGGGGDAEASGIPPIEPIAGEFPKAGEYNIRVGREISPSKTAQADETLVDYDDGYDFTAPSHTSRIEALAAMARALNLGDNNSIFGDA